MSTPTAPAVLVLIPTPSKPIRIRRIAARPDLPASLVVRGADFRSLRWSNDYQQFVSPHGPVQALVKKRAGGAFMLQVEDEIDDGRSWEVPVLIAHRLADRGHPFATSDDEALMVVFATGQVDFDAGKGAADQKIGAGEYHLAEKIRAAVPMLRDAAGRGARVVCLIPPGPGSEEAVKLLERALPNTNRWIARCETYGDITATLDLAVSNLGATPNPLMLVVDPAEARAKAHAAASAQAAPAEAPASAPSAATAAPPPIGGAATPPPVTPMAAPSASASAPPTGAACAAQADPPKPPSSKAGGVSMGVMAAIGAVVLSLGGVAALVATGTLSIGGGSKSPTAPAPLTQSTTATPQGGTAQPDATPAPAVAAAKAQVAALRPPPGKSCADLAFDPNLQLVATLLVPVDDQSFPPIPAFELCGLEFRPATGGSAEIDASLNAITFRRSAVGPQGDFGAGTRLVFRAVRLPALAPKLTVRAASGETTVLGLSIQP